MDTILQTRRLTKTYGAVNALDSVTMAVPKGSIYGFVGKNGSGKTTLMRIVAGLVFPSGGEFALYGQTKKSGLLAARKRMGAVIETPAIFPNMTARDNLKAQCRVIGCDDNKIGGILKTVNLSGTGDKKAKNFSLGMKQRLGIAMALIGEPDFLMLDEPINGLDPEGIVETRELLLRLNKERGVTILISSHILSELSRLATHYGFIGEGRLIEETAASEVEKQAAGNLEEYFMNMIRSSVK
ncbi:MAG: ATP-binding cassette domain-containing protein [Syntrophomonadaceae bacterium]|jgi:ABC-2 type transport system ATP-binding protein|nr:ATP-binding cassette domain-containing protein [Syntrophomonadaceae bacterium]